MHTIILFLLLSFSIFFPFLPITASALEFELKFDANDYGAYLWTSSGATQTYVSDGGWSGGAAKFTHPTSGEGYSGLANFGSLGSANRLNFRFLQKVGTDYGICDGNKNIIIMRTPYADGSRAIGMYHGHGPNQTDIAVCKNIDCVYSTPIWYLETYANQWVCYEYEANLDTNTFKVFVTTLDSVFDATVVATTVLDTLTSHLDYIQIMGGYYQTCSSPGPNNWVMYDELKVSTSGYIGPPSGFGAPTAPTITNITSSKANGRYGLAEEITIVATFSEAVTSTGNVTATFETGETDRTCTFTLTSETEGGCTYTVQAGDTSADLDVALSGTIVADATSLPMTNFTPTVGLAANKALVIDTTAPTLSNVIPTGQLNCPTDPGDKILYVTTNENANCRHHATSTTWAEMAAMDSTGTTAHSTTVNYVCDAAYTRKVVCQDLSDPVNESAASTWSFSIAALAASEKSMTIGGGSQTIIVGGGSQTISW